MDRKLDGLWVDTLDVVGIWVYDKQNIINGGNDKSKIFNEAISGSLDEIDRPRGGFSVGAADLNQCESTFVGLLNFGFYVSKKQIDAYLHLFQ